MKRNNQNNVASDQPQPQIVYVQQQKKGGCFSGFFKMIGIGVLALIILGVVGSMMGGDDSDTSSFSSSNSNKSSVTKSNEKKEVKEVGSGENPAPIGTTVTNDGLAITVHSVTETDTAGVLTTSEAGWSYLILDVTIKNVSDEKKSFNALYFSAKDMDLGYTYDDELFGSGSGSQMSAGDLSPNDLVRGEVVIKVQTQGTNIRIKYDTNPFGGKNLYWIYKR